MYLAFGLQLGQAERDNEEYILANKFSTEVCVALSKLASPYQQMIKLISKYTAFVFFMTKNDSPHKINSQWLTCA